MQAKPFIASSQAVLSMTSNNSASHSESFYEWMDYIIPVSSLIAMVGISFLYICCLLFCKKDWSFKLAYIVSKIVFSRLDESADKDRDGISTYSLFETPISHTTLATCFVVTTTILALAVVVALEVFLLDESDICDSGFDCFDIANGTYIEDCSNLVGKKARCYRLVYRIDLAVPALGGVKTVASSSITFYKNVMLLCQKKFVDKCGGRGVHIFFISTWLIIIVINIVGTIVLTFGVRHLPKAEKATAFIYLLTIVISISGTSWIVWNNAKPMLPKDSVADEESNLINIQH